RDVRPLADAVGADDAVVQDVEGAAGPDLAVLGVLAGPLQVGLLLRLHHLGGGRPVLLVLELRLESLAARVDGHLVGVLAAHAAALDALPVLASSGGETGRAAQVAARRALDVGAVAGGDDRAGAGVGAAADVGRRGRGVLPQGRGAPARAAGGGGRVERLV